jgi:hypothetical protein
VPGATEALAAAHAEAAALHAARLQEQQRRQSAQQVGA